jgi:hypothetical protein
MRFSQTVFFKSKAFATIEYIVLVVAVLGALVVMKQYLTNATAGKYVKAGEQFGFRRQFNPVTMQECVFEPGQNYWYARSCFEQRISGCSTVNVSPWEAFTGQAGCISSAKWSCRGTCSAPPP